MSSPGGIGLPITNVSKSIKIDTSKIKLDYFLVILEKIYGNR